MSYLAIARKYRPATFAGIVGQEHVTRTLQNALERNRIHHAYLFCGARGVGKTTAARALAKSLSCVNGPTPTPCGECVPCRSIASGTSPDLIEIDGASNNGVDDVRELRETVAYLPTQGRYKVYLVDEVHMLTRAAFNALLKTLEEPPAHVVFLFATTEPAKIPDTILSRVQRFDFKRIPVRGVVERLREIADAEGTEISDASLRLIARAGEGSMRDAQSLLDKVISFGTSKAVTDREVSEILGLIDRRILHSTLEGMVKGEPAKVLEAIDTVYGYGFELTQFSEELLEVLRNATFLRLSPESARFVDIAEDEAEALVAIVKDAEPEQLHRLFDALIDVHDQVSRAPRPRLVLEMAAVRLATPRSAQPLGQLVRRLEELERRTRTPGKAEGTRRAPR
ncbi:MAG: DNA polymerase III subunit gamma/tau [Alphaproteobacteria bacterium]|nr:DNA polymerase III subunit gamma/tau [Alphaproteobacteria bacterium]